MNTVDSFTRAVGEYIADEIVSKAIRMGYLKSLGYQSDPDGMVDTERLCVDLKERLSVGPVILSFPFAGDIRFSAQDVDEFMSHLD